MISEGSCDTNDWGNDAENSALHHKNKFNLKIYSHRKQIFKIVIIFHNIIVFQHLTNHTPFGKYGKENVTVYFSSIKRPKNVSLQNYQKSKQDINKNTEK